MPPDVEALAGGVGAQGPGEPLAIICGGGSFPGAVAEAVTRRGRRAVMFAVKGWADASLIERHPHHWVALGQVGRFRRLANDEGCRDVLLIGTLLRPPLRQIRLDWQTIRLMPRIVSAFRGGDDWLLSSIGKMMEEAGLRLVGLKDVASDIIVPEGTLGRHQPSARDRSDIARALDLIAAMGPFDVGQAVVVADNHVLAVEAAEGTDNLLLRLADLRRQGRVATPERVGALVKAPKPAQDRRFDLPAIGPATVTNAARAGLAGIAVAAGNTIIADAAETVAAADDAGIFLSGVSEARA
ncbi:MAG: UDP-2,3-diacylglucosamine diphosphatase LpxI [Xanthobacteraceae bacterium]